MANFILGMIAGGFVAQGIWELRQRIQKHRRNYG